VKISYSHSFVGQARQLTPVQRQALVGAIELFGQDPLHVSLRNHPLKAKYKVYRSIDVASDLRALYIQKNNEVVFVEVGTHKQLYE